MKVKNLEFMVSGDYGTKTMPHGGWSERHSAARCANLCSPEQVEKAINDELKKLSKFQIVDIKINFWTLCFHNNGGCNSVMESVAIVYK